MIEMTLQRAVDRGHIVSWSRLDGLWIIALGDATLSFDQRQAIAFCAGLLAASTRAEA